MTFVNSDGKRKPAPSKSSSYSQFLILSLNSFQHQKEYQLGLSDFPFFTMVGQPTVTKPSRSDEVVDADQQQQITNQVRAHFESLAPNRPTKPNRSESDSTSTPPITSYVPDQHGFAVPELDKLISLQSQSHATLFGTSPVVQEEFMETHYYEELDSVDKQHHKTGSGFIKVASEINGNDYDLRLENNHGGIREVVFKTNPATNEWIPSLDNHQVACKSSKPDRSESS
ncbi:uncharacterized protein [Coffea arabica]|uniref:Maternal effect embryo arrest 59 n=1 Tax=Coffea arabica TaxID=13443 RepID=A0A6P6TDQ7_COFAR|nr:uncharacterized protein LOC113700422 [Coffea arabica]